MKKKLLAVLNKGIISDYGKLHKIITSLGGVKSDWVCAASLDIGIRFSLFTGQITHRIDENIDEERNLIADELIEHGLVEERKLYTHFTNPYRSRNGGGDKISTDGSLVYLKLKKKTQQTIGI